MKTKEFNLSEKILDMTTSAIEQHELIYVSDVKEFIRLLKEKFIALSNEEHGHIVDMEIIELIDKLAGDKLK